MNIINIIKEEYDNMVLSLYHVTVEDNLDSIVKNGLRVGDRKMQGKGLYSFYDYNHSVRYAMKGSPYDIIIVKFIYPISDIDIILNKSIADKVYGVNDSSLVNQVNRVEWDGIRGMEGFIRGVKMAYKRNITEQEVIDILDDIDNDNSEINQRLFWGEMIPYDWNNKLNIILNGNYGIECRINDVDSAKVVGYYSYNERDFEFEYNGI